MADSPPNKVWIYKLKSFVKFFQFNWKKSKTNKPKKELAATYHNRVEHTSKADNKEGAETKNAG